MFNIFKRKKEFKGDELKTKFTPTNFNYLLNLIFEVNNESYYNKVKLLITRPKINDYYMLTITINDGVYVYEKYRYYRFENIDELNILDMLAKRIIISSIKNGLFKNKLIEFKPIIKRKLIGRINSKKYNFR